jgi:hypothetical protein
MQNTLISILYSVKKLQKRAEKIGADALLE